MTNDKINETKKAVYDILQKYVDFAQQTRIWILWGGLLLSAIVFDCCPRPYINSFIRDIFAYDLGSLVAVIVVIWTFTVTVGMYGLSQQETQYYEIRLKDIFFRTFTIRRATALISSVALEILLLIVSVIMNWKITIAVIAFLQFHTTCFTFAVICLYFTRTTVILMARKELQNIVTGNVGIYQIEQNVSVAVCVAKNTDYSNEYERDLLWFVLNSINSISLQKGCVKDDNADKTLRKMCAMLVDGILAGKGEYWGQIYPVIRKWFSLTDNLSIKKGIIQELIENHRINRQVDFYRSCVDLIETERPEFYEAIGLWALAYYWYSSCFAGYEWQKQQCKNLISAMPNIMEREKIVDAYLTKYCNSLDIRRIDLENYINYCKKEDEK